MDQKRFELLVSVLRIIERKGIENNIKSIFQILRNYDFELTSDQRSDILKDIIRYSQPERYIEDVEMLEEI